MSPPGPTRATLQPGRSGPLSGVARPAGNGWARAAKDMASMVDARIG